MDVTRDEAGIDDEEQGEREEGVDDGLGFFSDGLFHVGLRLQRQERETAAKGSRPPDMDIPGPRC